MSRGRRQNHSPAFKAKVALAAIKGRRTLSKLAEQFDVKILQVEIGELTLENDAPQGLRGPTAATIPVRCPSRSARRVCY